jgi:hypothetical protein
MSLILAGQSETELRGHLSLPDFALRFPLRSLSFSLGGRRSLSRSGVAQSSGRRTLLALCAHRSTKLHSSGFIRAGPMPLGVIPEQTDVRRTRHRSLAQVKD